MYTVYKHTTPSGKVYIGTTSKKPEYRWNNGKGYMSNKRFCDAILKYGWENIEHEVISTGLDKGQAYAMEVELIAKYDATNPAKGYNISIGGECGALGIHHSQATRQKISEAKKGHALGPETRRKISEALKGANSPNYGKHLSPETRQKISEAHKGKKVSEHVILAMTEATSKKVLCVETGEVYKSISEAGRQLGISSKAISNVCRGKAKTSGGYHWEYAEEPR